MIDLSKRIVCAANRYFNNWVICGPRHCDEVMHRIIPFMPDGYLHNEEQGFVNTWGHFLTRKQAWKVACYNTQIRRLVGNQVEKDTLDFMNSGTELYSENLY